MKDNEFALLKVIESTMADIKEDVKEIKESLKSKVEHADFRELKLEVEDLKKSKWTMMGFAAAVSYMVNYFFK